MGSTPERRTYEVAATIDSAPRYPARLEIDYTERRNRLTTALRIILVIPIFLIMAILDGAWGQTGLGIGTSLFIGTALMIVFRQRYPRWWFDFTLALTRFNTRVFGYLGLLVDEYPSTEDDRRVHLELDYPDTKKDLNRWLPLIKWLLALPHWFVLIVMLMLAFFVTLIAWFAILLTGRYPRGLFNFTVGVSRWWLRVFAYAFLLVTDRYPPFRLEP